MTTFTDPFRIMYQEVPSSPWLNTTREKRFYSENIVIQNINGTDSALNKIQGNSIAVILIMPTLKKRILWF